MPSLFLMLSRTHTAAFKGSGDKPTLSNMQRYTIQRLTVPFNELPREDPLLSHLNTETSSRSGLSGRVSWDTQPVTIRYDEFQKGLFLPAIGLTQIIRRNLFMKTRLALLCRAYLKFGGSADLGTRKLAFLQLRYLSHVMTCIHVRL